MCSGCQSGIVGVDNKGSGSLQHMEVGTSALIVAKPGALRGGLQALLSSISAIQSVELVDDGPTALKLLAGLHPRLALLEGDSSSDRVWSTLREIKGASPQTRCIVLVENVQQGQSADALQADAVLLQGTSPDEVVAAIERLLSTRELH
jgi:DNA-binding NarL/FixJ family response regulator